VSAKILLLLVCTLTPHLGAIFFTTDPLGCQLTLAPYLPPRLSECVPSSVPFSSSGYILKIFQVYHRELRDNDTWVTYSAAIRTEYCNEREAADAQLKLGQLKYQGNIRAYMMEFWALNNYARATRQGLQEKENIAMPNLVLDMRFAQYLEDFADDEGFLQTTYQAAIQVEKKKALCQAREGENVTLTRLRWHHPRLPPSGNNLGTAVRGYPLHVRLFVTCRTPSGASAKPTSPA